MMCSISAVASTVTTACACSMRSTHSALVEYVKAAQALRSPFVGNGRESTDWAFNIIAAVRELDAAEAALLAALRGGK